MTRWHKVCSLCASLQKERRMPTIGIDAIAIAVPEGYVDLADLATARGIPPTKYTEGLGVTRMAVARAHEDPVALAANAARRLFQTAALEPGISGSYAKDVNDFWRPLYTKDAVVDGHHSVQCYLDALAGAYDAWRTESRAAGFHPDSLVRRAYHVPYGKMAKKAHRHLM